MRALQAICIVGAITFTGLIHQVAHTPAATVPDAMQEAVVSAETPALPALSAAGPELPAGSGRVPAAVSGPSAMAEAEIGDDPNGDKICGLESPGCRPTGAGNARCVRRCFQPGAGDAGLPVSRSTTSGQNCRLLEKPAETVLKSLEDTPVGTPVEEIKRASDAFGLDFNFMKAVARIEFSVSTPSNAPGRMSACSS